MVPIRTEQELVAEVFREQEIERGDTVEDEEDECEEEELEMSIREILSLMTNLQRVLLSRGDICICMAKMLALAQDEMVREEMLNARQTTLDRCFGRDASE